MPDVAHQRPDVGASADIKPPRAPRQRPTVKSARTGRPPVAVGTTHNGRTKRADGRWMTDRQVRAEATAARRARHITDRVFVPIHPVDRDHLARIAAAYPKLTMPQIASDIIHAALGLQLGHLVDLVTVAER